jgi:hypothetical protein
VFYDQDARRRRTRVLAASPSARVRVAVMRVVRELAMNHVHRAGGVVLHAAAFMVDGRAIAVAGPKRAGKTTLLLHALQSGASDCLANDRLAVVGDGLRAIGRGIPTIVNLRVSSAACFASLEARLVAQPYDYRFTLEEGRQSPAEAVVPLDAWTLTQAQLCELVGVCLAPRAPIAAILFPRMVPDETGIEIHEVSKTVAVAILLDALFPAPGTDALFSDAEPLSAGAPTAAQDRCSAMLGGVASYECRLGGRAYVDHTWLKRLDVWSL